MKNSFRVAVEVAVRYSESFILLDLNGAMKALLPRCACSSCAEMHKLVMKRKRQAAIIFIFKNIIIMETLYSGDTKIAKKRVLVAEHITQDLTFYHNGPSTGEQITLENL